MKDIPLTQGKVAIVDDEDFDELSKYKWYTHKRTSRFYASRSSKRVNGKQRGIQMHRVIMNAPEGMDIDHINGDSLDNRKKNLRICTRSENLRNRSKNSNNTSGYKGIYWSKWHKKWGSQIMVNKKHIYLGYFIEKEEAYKTYCEASRKYHGKFSNL